VAEINFEKMAQDAAEKVIQDLRDNGVFVARWIPVSEGLPEDGDRSLVTSYCKLINRKRISISICFVNKDGFWSDIPLGYDVIAWIPLPKPYKAESEGE
jgi:hypothetical protein